LNSLSYLPQPPCADASHILKIVLLFSLCSLALYFVSVTI
jgi:hypothetical protein